MSSEIVKLIAAAPGWRVVSVWSDDGAHKFDYEPIIAWAEVGGRPGELVPMRRDGICEMAVFAQDAEDLTFLALLAPGETVDHTSENWKVRIRAVLERQAKQDARDVRALAVVKASEPG